MKAGLCNTILMKTVSARSTPSNTHRSFASALVCDNSMVPSRGQSAGSQQGGAELMTRSGGSRLARLGWRQCDRRGASPGEAAGGAPCKSRIAAGPVRITKYTRNIPLLGHFWSGLAPVPFSSPEIYPLKYTSVKYTL